MSAVATDEASDVFDRRRAWFKLFYRWQAIAWSLLAWVAIGSTFVAAALDNLEHPLINHTAAKLLALSVAGASALLATLNPQKRARAYRLAWVELDQAIKAEAQIPVSHLAAIKAGERIIGEDGGRSTDRLRDPK